MLLGSIFLLKKNRKILYISGSQWLRCNDDEDSKVSQLVSLLRFYKLLMFVTPPFFSKKKIENDYCVKNIFK